MRGDLGYVQAHLNLLWAFKKKYIVDPYLPRLRWTNSRDKIVRQNNKWDLSCVLLNLASLQSLGGGFPDAALPGERHLVLGPDVPVCSVSPPGLPLLLPQHSAGPSHHHPALHPCQEGLYLSHYMYKNLCDLIVCDETHALKRCVCRVRRTMADACASRSAASPPRPVLRIRWRALPCDPTAATPAARVGELQLTDRFITVLYLYLTFLSLSLSVYVSFDLVGIFLSESYQEDVEWHCSQTDWIVLHSCRH